ncbi:MAG: tRNA pseudouridine(55) synthase TruB, partial [Lachnospiraceae bacterium]|nr:tRNA pseudouridine(55) synthase TruB [Lachnospiraceae bacterium]
MDNISEIEGGALIIDKEKGWTSFDVVNKLRHVLRVKKAGHTGTLDPNATGVLVVLFGRATKLSDKLTHDTVKRYEAEMLLGITTDTQDITGEVLSKKDASEVTEEALMKVMADFSGDLLQKPPMYSAKKKDGKKLYEYAREGVLIEREPVPIHVFENSLKSFEDGRAVIEVSCSAGTYIRTLINDMGEALFVGACMGDL